MIVTIAVVYKPQWISTFDDRHYLKPLRPVLGVLLAVELTVFG